MLGGATQAMSVYIVEDPERSSGRAPGAAAHRPAGPGLRSRLAYPAKYARRSYLRCGAEGRQQNVKLFLREPLGVL